MYNISLQRQSKNEKKTSKETNGLSGRQGKETEKF
jgi:hypothetical protein